MLLRLHSDEQLWISREEKSAKTNISKVNKLSPPPTVFPKTTLTRTITLNTQSPPPTVFPKTTLTGRSHSTLSHHHLQSFPRLHSPRRSHSTLSHHHLQSLLLLLGSNHFFIIQISVVIVFTMSDHEYPETQYSRVTKHTRYSYSQ